MGAAGVRGESAAGEAKEESAAGSDLQVLELPSSIFLTDPACFNECFPTCQDLCLNPPKGFPKPAPKKCFDLCQATCTRACPPRFKLTFEGSGTREFAAPSCAEELARDEYGIDGGTITGKGEVAAATVCDRLSESVANGNSLQDIFCTRNNPAARLQAQPAAWANNRCARFCAQGVCLGLPKCRENQVTAPGATNVNCVPAGRCGRGRNKTRWSCNIAMTTGSYGCNCACR